MLRISRVDATVGNNGQFRVEVRNGKVKAQAIFYDVRGKRESASTLGLSPASTPRQITAVATTLAGILSDDPTLVKEVQVVLENAVESSRDAHIWDSSLEETTEEAGK